MKIFNLWLAGMAAEEQNIWCKAGFAVVEKLPLNWQEALPIDMIWLAESPAISAKAMAQTVEGLHSIYPKLFFLHGSAISRMPAHWQAYAQQTVSVNGSTWLIGSKLEEPLPTALIEYFSQQKTTDLAAVMYMTLLESAFRETAEWCGHMSSVVGRM
jgi:hypothetical protein